MTHRFPLTAGAIGGRWCPAAESRRLAAPLPEAPCRAGSGGGERGLPDGLARGPAVRQERVYGCGATGSGRGGGDTAAAGQCAAAEHSRGGRDQGRPRSRSGRSAGPPCCRLRSRGRCRPGSSPAETAPLSPIGIGLAKTARAGCQQAAYDRGQPAQAWKAIQLANSGAPAKTGSHPLQRKYPHQTMLMPGNALSAAK